ncbi:MAG TPA: TldD/PmbA family protein [bacterium]|nr:TldD/PmbA family protein [bacterium]
MEWQTAVDFALSLAREHRESDVDVLLNRSESLAIKVLNHRVEKVDQSTAQGLGVRVVKDGRTGIAYTERLEPPAIEKAFLAARENAELPDPTEVVMNRALPEVPDPATLELFNPALDALTVDDLARFGLEAEAAAFAADARVKAVPYTVVKRENGRYLVASTHGMRYSQHSNSVGAYCSAMLDSGTQRKSGTYAWASRAWDATQGAALGREAAGRGAALLGARSIPGGRLPVVLDEYVAPDLLSMYLGNFSAEAAQKGMSRLRGRLGEPIADAAIALTDDPHRVGAPGSRYLDAEGVATQPLPLIEGGVFRNFLYHVESARKDGRESTGHAGRGYSGGISTRTHSVVMPTGTHDLDALCAIPERCLLVTELEGGAGCNPVSGDISIGVQGYLIEGGRRMQPVDSVTIAGNFFDLLRNIRAVGDRYQPNLTNRFIPALLVEGLVLSG